MSPERLSVSYALTLEDIHHFNHHYARASKVARRGRLLARLALTAFLAVLLGALGWGAHAGVGFWVVGALILAFWFATFPARVEQMLRRHTARTFAQGKNLGLLGPTTVEADPERIVEKNALRETHVKWPAVERVDVDSGRVYVWTSAFSAMVIPARAFESDAARDAFVAAVRERIAGAAG